jgi:hypothetical protein
MFEEMTVLLLKSLILASTSVIGAFRLRHYWVDMDSSYVLEVASSPFQLEQETIRDLCGELEKEPPHPLIPNA